MTHAQPRPLQRDVPSSVTVYGGDRFGGGVTDSTTNSTINLANGSSFALAVDIGLGQQHAARAFL